MTSQLVPSGLLSGMSQWNAAPAMPASQPAAAMPSWQSLNAWGNSPLGAQGIDPSTMQLMGAGGPTGGAAAPQGWMGKIGDWASNGQNLGGLLQGIGALGSAYMGFQQLKAAKEGLDFQKEAFQANLGNSTQAYNTSLEDRIRGRTADYAGKEADVQSYLGEHSLDKPKGS